MWQSANLSAAAPLPAIAIEALRKRFGHSWILRDIHLEIGAGQFCSIFGPNGAGKSTLMRILATLSTPTSGRVSVRGLDLVRDAAQVRRLIGYVAHQPMLYADLSAGENLTFFARLYGVPEPEARIDSLLRSVDLRQRRNDLVRTFSRGMLQRLALARALLADPPILLLDEPDDGLDPQAAEQLPALLAGDRTVLMISHHLARGYNMATRVVLLAQGRVVFDTPTRDISIAELEQQYRRLSAAPAGGVRQPLAA